MKRGEIHSRLQEQLYRSNIGRTRFYLWNHWALYLDPDMLSAVIEQLVEKVRDRISGVDYLCPLPKSGMPLCSILADHLKIPLFHYWFGKDLLARAGIPQKASIALCDSIINSGTTLKDGCTLLAHLDPSTQFLVTVIYNDMYPAKQNISIKTEWEEDGKLVYLYRMSELR